MNILKNQNGSGSIIAIYVIGGIAAIAALMFIIPTWSVWQQNMKGKAKLAKASQERQILVEQAKAEKEAAQHTAEAIEIVGEAAQKYPEYRTQQFIMAFSEALQEGNIEQIMYVATEAGIPITEAGRMVSNK